MNVRTRRMVTTRLTSFLATYATFQRRKVIPEVKQKNKGKRGGYWTFVGSPFLRFKRAAAAIITTIITAAIAR